MGYSRNFGFRSFENIVRDGRSRIPHDSTEKWVLGTGVVIDTETQGFVRKPDEGDVPSPACGVLVYEHIQYKGDDPYLVNPTDKDTVPPGEFVQVVRGNGAKIWLRNTADKPLYDGRKVSNEPVIAADQTLELGAYLAPNNDGLWEVTADAADGWLWIEQYDAESGLAECRLTF